MSGRSIVVRVSIAKVTIVACVDSYHYSYNKLSIIGTSITIAACATSSVVAIITIAFKRKNQLRSMFA